MRHERVEAMAEAQNEGQYDEHHCRDEQVHLVALERKPQDQRDQGR